MADKNLPYDPGVDHPPGTSIIKTPGVTPAAALKTGFDAARRMGADVNTGTFTLPGHNHSNGRVPSRPKPGPSPRRVS